MCVWWKRLIHSQRLSVIHSSIVDYGCHAVYCIPRTYSLHSWKSVPFDLIPHNPTPASGNLFFVSMSSVTLDSTYEWNHLVFVCLCLTYFTYCNALKVHPCHKQQDSFLFLWLNNIPLCICTTLSLSIHPSADTHPYLDCCE